MGSNLGNTDGTVSEANLAYFKRRVQSGAGFIITAVSYTHLRAHETPEHLVCRLLLEKKKQNSPQNIKSSTSHRLRADTTEAVLHT